MAALARRNGVACDGFEDDVGGKLTPVEEGNDVGAIHWFRGIIPMQRDLIRSSVDPPSYTFHNNRREIGNGGLTVTNLYVDNLSARTSESSIRKLFERHGSVCRVHIVTVVSDQDASQPCRLGLVEMATDVEGEKAIAALNGTKFGGSTIRVNEALTKRMGSSGAEWR